EGEVVGGGGVGEGGGDLDEEGAAGGQGVRVGTGEPSDGGTAVGSGHCGAVTVPYQRNGEGQAVAARGRDDDLLAGSAGEAVAVGEEAGPVDAAAVPRRERPTLGLANADGRVRLTGIAGDGGLHSGARSRRTADRRWRPGEYAPGTIGGRNHVDPSVEHGYGDQDRAVPGPLEGIASVAVLVAQRRDRRDPSRGRGNRRLRNDGLIRRDTKPGRLRGPGSCEQQRSQRRDGATTRAVCQHPAAGVERL